MLNALNKRVVQLLAALILLGMSPMTYAAYPDRPLTLIVPFAAGGPTDVLARVVAESLTKVLGQPVIVENTPGAGGTVGGTRAARATGDGYTMLIGNGGTLAVNATLYKNLTYDVLKDFIPVASIGDAPQIISARKDFPATGLDEFAAYLKQNAAKLNFGAAGVGSGTWLGGQLINVRLGVKVNGVNYRGAGQAVNDVPSAGESGFPDLLYDIWNMILVPKGTPPEIVKKLNQSLLLALQAPELRTRFEAAGIEDPSPEQKTPEGARALLTSEVARWRPVIIDLGATPE